VIALVAFGTYRLVGAARRPVDHIRARVSSLTSGNLAERIPVPAADDEIAHLAVTMNDMLDRLEGGQTAQRRFDSDASHELRSPLATLIAALELADDRPELLDRTVIEESLLPEAHRMRGRQLRSFVLAEAAVLVVCGVTTGTLLGWALSRMLVRVLAGVFDPPPSALSVPWEYLAATVGAIIVAICTASGLTVRLARRSSVTVLREL
jgi:HAMP domain-containing protein